MKPFALAFGAACLAAPVLAETYTCSFDAGNFVSPQIMASIDRAAREVTVEDELTLAAGQVTAIVTVDSTSEITFQWFAAAAGREDGTQAQLQSVLQIAKAEGIGELSVFGAPGGDIQQLGSCTTG